MLSVGSGWVTSKRKGMQSLGVLSRERGLGEEKGKKQTLFFITLRRHLVHLFSCRSLLMWSEDCRPFSSEKTNTTLISLQKL
ncbi:hypothetical protein Hanom_Chr04g00354061 [Helianthus anomalus]